MIDIQQTIEDPVGRFDVGICEGVPQGAEGTLKTRSVDLVAFFARDEREAIDRARAVWRYWYGDEPPSALIGISWRYCCSRHLHQETGECVEDQAVVWVLGLDPRVAGDHAGSYVYPEDRHVH